MKAAEKRPNRTHPGPSLDGPAVVAYTTQDDEHHEVRRTATVHARAHGCVLILYAADVASLWSEPMPNQWDSDGEAERFGDRLSPEDLEFLGRSVIADQVRDGWAAGAKTSAWLPKDKGIEPLLKYAREQGAHIVFVPDSVESIDGIDGGLPDALRLVRVPEAGRHPGA